MNSSSPQTIENEDGLTAQQTSRFFSYIMANARGEQVDTTAIQSPVMLTHSSSITYNAPNVEEHVQRIFSDPFGENLLRVWGVVRYTFNHEVNEAPNGDAAEDDGTMPALERLDSSEPPYSATQSSASITASMPLTKISATTPCTSLTDQCNADASMLCYNHRRLEQMGDECMVCRDKFEVGYEMGCAHIGCVECLVRWLKEKKSCPTCRREVVHSEALLVVVKDDEYEGDVEAEGGIGEDGGVEKQMGGEEEHEVATVARTRQAQRSGHKDRAS